MTYGTRKTGATAGRVGWRTERSVPIHHGLEEAEMFPVGLSRCRWVGESETQGAVQG